MRQRLIGLVLMILVTLCAAPVFAQITGTVRGVCKDLQGKPIVGAVVEWANADTGQKYTIKTNNKGEYFSLGITPGRYLARLLKDGKEIYHLSLIHI